MGTVVAISPVAILILEQNCILNVELTVNKSIEQNSYTEQKATKEINSDGTLQTKARKEIQ